MTPTLVIVPGLGGSGPQHWQSLWETKFGGVRVVQDDWDHPTPAAWTARLHEVIEATPGELVLVAHSCGVPTVAHWAARTGGHARVRGALLVAPPDVDLPLLDFPAVAALAPQPLGPLPFPALVVSSETDPFVTLDRAQAFAEAWEAEFVTAGEAGHLNTGSGHGDWPEGEILLSEVLHAWTPPDIARF